MKINKNEMKKITRTVFKDDGFFDKYIENHPKRMLMFAFEKGFVLTNSDNELLSFTIDNNESEFISDCMEKIKYGEINPILIY